MAKSSKQKLKLLYLLRFLMQYSDEEHPLSTAQLIAELAENGISAERKSIYADIEELRLFGIDIIQVKGKTAVIISVSVILSFPSLSFLLTAYSPQNLLRRKKHISLSRK